jgi:hypothetical protein
VREELQCSGCGRIRTGAAGPRVENVEEEAAEGTALMQADHGPHGGGGVIMVRRIGRRSCEVKATAGRDELGGATVQPGTASSLHPCGGRGRSNVVRVRRAAQDQRWW